MSVTGMIRDASTAFVSTGGSPLAERFERGDPEACATVRRWIRAAAGPYRRVVGDDLEDLEQEILVSLLDALRDGRFEGRSRLSTYVKKAVVYRCLNRIRDRRKRVFVPPDDVRLEWSGPDPSRETADRDELARATEVLASMSDTCREMWRLLGDGLTYSEMGDRLGVAVGTLRVRVSRCRKRALRLWEDRTGTPR